MSDQIEIREPLPEENEAIAEIVNAQVPLYESIMPLESMSRIGLGNMTAERISQHRQKRDYLVALIDGKVVAYAAWYILPPGLAWVSMLHVHPDYYRQGIGGKLLQTIEEQAQTLGAVAVGLETQKLADWALKFYQQSGYQILAEADFAKSPFNMTPDKSRNQNSYVLAKSLYNAYK